MAEPDLGGKVAVVTGGGGGMGSVMTLALAAAGATAVAVDIDRARLEALGERARADGLGERVKTIAADIADVADCLSVVPRVLGLAGGLHMLVNNAGVGMLLIDPDYSVKEMHFWQANPGAWQRIMDVNVRAPLLLTQAAVPHLMAQGWGRVVNVTTSYDTMVRPKVWAYGQSKAALEAMTASWASELAGTGVTVNVLIPGGAVRTPMIPANTNLPPESLLDPEVMAPPIRWLAGAGSDGFTGRRIIATRWSTPTPHRDEVEAVSSPAGFARLAPAR